MLLSVLIPQILGHVRSVLSLKSDLPIGEIFESKPGFRFWLNIMEAVNDSHSVERIAEELLHQLALQNVNDVEGYWTLWILFSRISERQSSVRYVRLILHFCTWKLKLSAPFNLS